jgi:hypothetical protein
MEFLLYILIVLIIIAIILFGLLQFGIINLNSDKNLKIQNQEEEYYHPIHKKKQKESFDPQITPEYIDKNANIGFFNEKIEQGYLLDDSEIEKQTKETQDLLNNKQYLDFHKKCLYETGGKVVCDNSKKINGMCGGVVLENFEPQFVNKQAKIDSLLSQKMKDEIPSGVNDDQTEGIVSSINDTKLDYNCLYDSTGNFNCNANFEKNMINQDILNKEMVKNKDMWYY